MQFKKRIQVLEAKNGKGGFCDCPRGVLFVKDGTEHREEYPQVFCDVCHREQHRVIFRRAATPDFVAA